MARTGIEFFILCLAANFYIRIFKSNKSQPSIPFIKIPKSDEGTDQTSQFFTTVPNKAKAKIEHRIVYREMGGSRAEA